MLAWQSVLEGCERRNCGSVVPYQSVAKWEVEWTAQLVERSSKHTSNTIAVSFRSAFTPEANYTSFGVPVLPNQS